MVVAFPKHTGGKEHAKETCPLFVFSFIISNMVYADLSKHKSAGEVMSKSDLEAMSVLFQYDDPGTYIGKMMESMVKTGMQSQDS